MRRGSSAVDRAELDVTAGLNRGRSIRVQPDGRFRATGLYPGFLRLSIRTSQGRLERELSLRPNVPTRFDLDLAGGFPVQGRVVARSGEALAGIPVCVDGVFVHTDGLGYFQGATRASGRSWIEVALAGQARTRVELLRPPEDMHHPSHVEIVLAPACRLEIELVLPPGTTAPPHLFVVPGRTLRAARGRGRGAYPWSSLGAIEVTGGVFVLDDLPPGDVKVLGFQKEMLARSRSVQLIPERVARLRLEFQPVSVADVDASGDPWQLDPLRRSMLALGEHSGEVFTRPLEGLID